MNATGLANASYCVALSDVADPVDYVLSLNLHRRHLSPTQLAMVGAEARKFYEEQAKERKKRKPNSVPANLPEQKADARDAVGKALGVSGKTVDYASKVLRDGTGNLIAKVDADAATALLCAAPPDDGRDLRRLIR